MRLSLAEVYVLNKYRFKFEKTGKIIYIGHLDMLKLFQRTIKRARIGIDYSKGFNPHQLTTFAIPLSLGVSSTGEYCDIQLTEPMDEAEIMSRLNAVLPLGLKVTSVRRLEEGEKACASVVAAADYIVTLDGLFENISAVVENILAEKSIEIKRIVKKKEKTVDIRPMIYGLSADNSGEKTVINCRIATGSQGNLKVDALIEYIYGLLGAEYISYKIRVHRVELYKADDKGEFVCL